MWASEFVPGIAIIEVPEGLEDFARRLLEQTREFRYVGRDCWNAPTSAPNDPRWLDGSQPLTLDPICVQSLWNVMTTANEPIAIIDSGVAFWMQSGSLLPHPDLVGNIAVNTADPMFGAGNAGIDNDGNGYIDDYWGSEFLPPNPNPPSTFPLPRDLSGHGTRMASIAGASGNNGSEIAGVAWKAKLIIAKYSDASGVSSASSVLQAFEYAHKRGARILSCSFFISVLDPTGVTAVYDFILETPTTLYVQSAANNGVDIDANCYEIFPAEWSLSNMLVVGGTDPDNSPWSLDTKVTFPCEVRPINTNYGELSVDVMAPAAPVWELTHVEPGAAETGEGTSESTAITAAVAALVWTKYPALTALQVKQRIMDTVDVIPALDGWCVTKGRVNAARAVGATCP
jgi:thermitase